MNPKLQAVTTAMKPNRLTMPAEVQAFAEERGLTSYLPAILDVLHRVFADATRISVSVDDDSDEAGLRSIVFEADVPWSQEQWRTGMKAWRRETAAICPPPLLSEFTLITCRA